MPDVECRAHRIPVPTAPPYGDEDLPVRVEGEYVREVKRGKPVGDWRWVPRGCRYDVEHLFTWVTDHPRIAAAEVALTGALPEWEVGWRVAGVGDEVRRVWRVAEPVGQGVLDLESA